MEEMDEAEFLEKLRREFLTTTPGELDLWESKALAIEGAGDPALVDDLMRVIHSMKGSAQAVGLNEAALYLHDFERVVLHLKDSSDLSRLVSTVLAFVDEFRIYMLALQIGAETLAASTRIKTVLIRAKVL